MSCRHRRVPLLSILARLKWRRDPNSWTTGCWNGWGQRSTVQVTLAYGFVTLEGPSFELIYLSPLQIGHLRGVLKAAVLDLDLFGGQELSNHDVPARPEVVSVHPRARRPVFLSVPKPLTVGDLQARLAAPAQPGVTADAPETSEDTVLGIPMCRRSPEAFLTVVPT
jgi:hypothetical protein